MRKLLTRTAAVAVAAAMLASGSLAHAQDAQTVRVRFVNGVTTLGAIVSVGAIRVVLDQQVCSSSDTTFVVVDGVGHIVGASTGDECGVTWLSMNPGPVTIRILGVGSGEYTARIYGGMFLERAPMDPAQH